MTFVEIIRNKEKPEERVFLPLRSPPFNANFVRTGVLLGRSAHVLWLIETTRRAEQGTGAKGVCV